MAVLGLIYCSKILAQGGKKDATFRSEAFKPYVKKYDYKNSHTYLVFFDGALNVQKAGKILDASYPCITVFHGAEHVLSLFLQYCKIPSDQGETTLLV